MKAKYNYLIPIITLALPAIIENIMYVLLGIVDTYFVSKLGTEAIAGVGITNLTMNVYIAFFMALGIGTSAMIARYIGKKEAIEANKALHGAIKLSLLIGLVFGLINLIFSKQILDILGAEKDVIHYALPYFIAVAVPSVFLCVQMVLASALRGVGDTKTSMAIAGISNLINIVLDYILIFGLFNFSGLGILGAGLATTLARVFSVIFLIRSINSHDGPLQVSWTNLFKSHTSLIQKMLKLSLPAAIEKLIMRSGQIIYGGMIIRISTEAYASHNIAGTIESLSYLPGMGFGVAAATLVGQNLGRKDKLQARKDAWGAYYLSSIFMIVIGAIFYIWAPSLARLFSDDPQVVQMVVSVLRIIAFFQPFLCVTFVITSALQGAGDTRFPMYTSLIGIWGVRVLGVYILCMKLGYGLIAVWSVYALDVTVRGIILLTRFKKGKWQDIKIT